jgi:hypothetical protein
VNVNRPTPVCASNPRTAPTRIKNWRGAGPADHFVQFYRTDDYLIECLAGYVAEGLWNRDAAAIIATPAHRLSLEERLRVKGVDVIGSTLSRQFFTFDARELLGKFMVDDRPDATRFRNVIGEIVREATAKGRRLRAFGEMVALLWQDGNREGAIALEQLWNDLGREQAFALFCAYPAGLVDNKGDGPSLEHVCGAHTCVISLTE